MGADGRRTICFDLDGTLCTNTFGDYELAEPLPWAIERVNGLAQAGHRIVIFTARGTATGIDWEPVTRGQLELWDVSYDELLFGKPSADVYVDDRAVHTTAWRCGDALEVPGFPSGTGELPELAPAHLISVAEVGRTYACRAPDIDRHVQRVRELAARAGIRPSVPVESVRSLLQDAIEATGAREDLVFTVSISSGGHAGFVDVEEQALPRLRAACRPLRHVAAGLGPLMAPRQDGGFALAATTAGEPSAGWPIGRGEDEALCDLMGGQLGFVEDDRLVLEPTAEPPPVASRLIGDLARQDGIEIVSRPIRRDDLEASSEAMVVGLPFCILPLRTLDGEALWESAPGPVSSRLLQLWSERVGLDIEEQTSSLAEASSSPSVATPASG